MPRRSASLLWAAAITGALVTGVLAVTSSQTARSGASADVPSAGIRLGDLTWPLAEERLGAKTIVVIPSGAAAQEHGRHLRLSADAAIADYLARRLLAQPDVVVTPPLTYDHSPAFAEYPGSTSLGANTARDVAADVVRSLARHGARRFYVLNVSHSPAEALAAAGTLVAREGLLLHHTDWRSHLEALRALQQQPGGTHADEVETSLMLFIEPDLVDMKLATPDFRPAPADGPFRLTRRPGTPGIYSPTGAWGDPTLATREKDVPSRRHWSGR